MHLTGISLPLLLGHSDCPKHIFCYPKICLSFFEAKTELQSELLSRAQQSLTQSLHAEPTFFILVLLFNGLGHLRLNVFCIQLVLLLLPCLLDLLGRGSDRASLSGLWLRDLWLWSRLLLRLWRQTQSVCAYKCIHFTLRHTTL